MHLQQLSRAGASPFPADALITASYPPLKPLLDRTILVAAHVANALGTRSLSPGSLDVDGAALAQPFGQFAFRYGLELSWLLALPRLSPAAAAVLAARTAACSMGLATAPKLPQAFATLARQSCTPCDLHDVARALVDTHAGSASLTAHDLACIEALWPIAVPTERLLASGGDDRLTLNPSTGLNRYGCTPWPQARTISFSSCTASSLSEPAFAAAERARQALAAATLRTAPSVALAEASDAIGAALLAHFGVGDLAEAVLAASGTDAALVVTGLLAAERAGDVLTSILMAPSETGSGVPDAVQGRHFASSAAAGCKVGKGQPIEGMALGPHLVTIALRLPGGAPRLPNDITADCEAAIRRGAARGHVVLHAIDGSKTGLTAPDRATCRRLADTYGSSLDIVVDACQARMEPALARWYLQQGFPVLVTGSKFFAAPGFCGAVLFPRARLQRIARHGRLPAGLAPYARLEGGFGSRRCPGLVLRWRAALHQMDAFGALANDQIRHRLIAVGDTVRNMLGRDERVKLLRAPRPQGFGWSGKRSVFTFAIRGTEGWMTPGQLRPLYENLNADLSGSPGMGDRAIAGQPCQLGQPVEPGSSGLGALRIAISAAQLEEDTGHCSQLSIVFEKLTRLLDREADGQGAPAPAMSADAASPALLTG